jgi:hypothetical protein
MSIPGAPAFLSRKVWPEGLLALAAITAFGMAADKPALTEVSADRVGGLSPQFA